MKYIIMCGGNYNKFKTPKQLLEVDGEIIVERTIRLLKENGIKDIAISTNNPKFNYLDVEILHHGNEYTCFADDSNKKSKKTWLNAFYPIDVSCCYLYGDVYYSDEAIKKIIETPVKETMFFCIRDLSDGRPTGINIKGREPLAYKVQNQKIFRDAINYLLQMVDEGKYAEGIEPITWHLYRKINGLDLMFNYKGYNANDIFKTKGDYIYIDDYSTDIDKIEDIQKLEKFIKLVKGVKNMKKAIVIEDFNLGRFNELKNLERANEIKNQPGKLFKGDKFECEDELLKYLRNEEGFENPAKRPFIEIVEVIPEKTVKKEKTTKKEVEPAKKTVATTRKPRARKPVAKN